MRWGDVGSQFCSVARSLSVFGDRWTLIVLREAFSGASRFDEFHERVEASRAIIADRLAKLVDEGLLDRTQYQERPARYSYHLTDKGRDVFPVILSLITWGDKWMDDGYGAPSELVHKTCGKPTAAVPMCAHCGGALSDGMTFRPGPGSADRRAKRPLKKRSASKKPRASKRSASR